MYYPESFYEETEINEKVLKKHVRKNLFIVGKVDGWDSSQKALIVKFNNGYTGIIPEEEITLEDLKYSNRAKIGPPMQAKMLYSQKICADIVKIVGKTIYLSRKSVQMKAIGTLNSNHNYKVVVKSISDFGIYVDIAVGIIAFIHISEISTTRIKDVADIGITTGMTIDATILSLSPKICMSYRRVIPLKNLNVGDYSFGTVRFELDNQTGYFVEVSPNECGILDSTSNNGNKIHIPYGTRIKYRVKNMKVICDENGALKSQYRLKLVN